MTDYRAEYMARPSDQSGVTWTDWLLARLREAEADKNANSAARHRWQVRAEKAEARVAELEEKAKRAFENRAHRVVVIIESPTATAEQARNIVVGAMQEEIDTQETQEEIWGFEWDFEIEGVEDSK